MKERPILFSASMVNALLAGTKTQTRRAVKRVSRFSAASEPFDCIMDLDGLPSRLDLAPDNWELCPYGVPGDRLWVRETWGAADRFYQQHDLDTPAVVAYRADKSAIQWNQEPPRHIQADDLAQWNWDKVKWKPSIFMPRWASRITLEVTSTRVERLQEISEEDARAEGVEPDADCLTNRCARPCRDRYFDLWNEINGKGEWERNPWVWVVRFRRIP